MRNVVKATFACVQDGYLEIEFSTGMRGQWPISSLQFARRIEGELINFRPADAEVVDVEVWPSGEVIEFSQIDQAFQVAALMRGEVGNAKWMEQLAADVV